MSSDPRIPHWAERLRREIPNVAAVILKGSHARGAAGTFSDIDFDVLTDDEPREEYLAFFEEDGDGRLHHISVAVQDTDGWIADTHEPVSWGYGLGAAETTQLVWARDDALRDMLDKPARMHPPEEPELEDFIEAWGKIRNAHDREDDLVMRISAQKLARLCPTLLRPLNPESTPANRIEAMRAILAFPLVPEGYRHDMLRCLGLSGETVAARDLRQSAYRLTRGTVGLLMKHIDSISPLLPPDLATALADGRIERYIRQIAGED